MLTTSNEPRKHNGTISAKRLWHTCSRKFFRIFASTFFIYYPLDLCTNTEETRMGSGGKQTLEDHKEGQESTGWIVLRRILEQVFQGMASQVVDDEMRRSLESMVVALMAETNLIMTVWLNCLISFTCSWVIVLIRELFAISPKVTVHIWKIWRSK